MEQLVEQRAGAAQLRGQVVRVLHLTQHLRLSDDERVQAGRDAKQMTNRFGPHLGVEMRRQLARGHAMKLGDEPLDGGARAFHVFASDVQLHSVAGGHNGGLAVRWRACQGGQRAVHTTGREVEPLTQLHRRRAMTYANEQYLHVFFSRGPLAPLHAASLAGPLRPAPLAAFKNCGCS